MQKCVQRGTNIYSKLHIVASFSSTRTFLIQLQFHNMKIRLVQRNHAPDIDSEAWDKLANKSLTPNPFYERWSLLPALKYLGLEETIFIVTIYDNRELTGLFPVCLRGSNLHLRYLEIWKFKDCYLTDPLFSQDWVPLDIFNALMRQLNAHTLISSTHTIHGFGIETPNGAYRYHRSRGAITEFNGWETYLNKLSSKNRYEHKRVMSRLLGQKDVEYLTTDTDLSSKWLPIFLDIENNSWKGESGRATKQHSNRLMYIRETVKLGEEMQKIKFQVLYKRHEVLAVSFRYVTANTTYEIKTTYNDKYNKLYPGVVLELLNIQDLLNSDYLLADSCATPHNSVVNRIWPDQRKIFRTVLFRNTVRGKVAKIIYKARKQPQ